MDENPYKAPQEEGPADKPWCWIAEATILFTGLLQLVIAVGYAAHLLSFLDWFLCFCVIEAAEVLLMIWRRRAAFKVRKPVRMAYDVMLVLAAVLVVGTLLL